MMQPLPQDGLWLDPDEPVAEVVALTLGTQCPGCRLALILGDRVVSSLDGTELWHIGCWSTGGRQRVARGTALARTTEQAMKEARNA